MDRKELFRVNKLQDGATPAGIPVNNKTELKIYIKMGNSIYIIAVLLVIIWAIGFAAFSFGPFIHILLIIAAFIMLLNIFDEKRVMYEDWD